MQILMGYVKLSQQYKMKLIHSNPKAVSPNAKAKMTKRGRALIAHYLRRFAVLDPSNLSLCIKASKNVKDVDVTALLD